MPKETALSVLKEIRNLLKKRLPVVTGVIPQKQTRFVRRKDGTVIDNLLNLTWYPTLSKRMDWEEAKKECKKIGCRLPTRRELESLVDIKKHNPAIDRDIFPDTKTDDWYWTGDTCAWSSVFAWLVLFYYGSVSYYIKDFSNCVRPVRSSQ